MAKEPAWEELARLTDKTLTIGESASEGPYLVFRAAWRRYAVPVDCVRGMGRIEGASLMMGRVQTSSGTYPLRDVKALLGLEGESGRVYVVLSSKQGMVAWAVDGVESKAPLEATDRVELRTLHSGNGLIRGVLSTHPTSPIYVLDVEKVVASSRSPRGRQMRSTT